MAVLRSLAGKLRGFLRRARPTGAASPPPAAAAHTELEPIKHVEYGVASKRFREEMRLLDEEIKWMNRKFYILVVTVSCAFLGGLGALVWASEEAHAEMEQRRMDAKLRKAVNAKEDREEDVKG